jgi:hypothetical protein
LSEQQIHDPAALIASTQWGPRAEWVAQSLLVLVLTCSGLMALAALKVGIVIESLIPGAIGLVLAITAAAAVLSIGLAVGCLLAIPLLQYGFGDGPKESGQTRWPDGRKAAGAVSVMVLADAAAMLALDALLPFRFGLLSCLYFCLPAVLLACSAAPRSRRRLLTLVVVLTAGVLFTLPARALQTSVAAAQWLGGSGVSGRAQAQVVVLPGLMQEPYAMDGGTLVAQFDTVQDGLRTWTAVETVTAGRLDPCAPVLVADGDADDTESLSCTQVASDLWLRGGQLGQGTGYVLERDGVTITVTEAGMDIDTDQLRQVILAAHPASDSELWTREGSTKYSLTGLLLL